VNSATTTETGLHKWAFPNDPELSTLTVTLPVEIVAAIDAAVERFDSLQDRDDFIFMAVEYALASLEEEAAAARMVQEERDGGTE
jgi:Arc/MetJ-type ribon-helix-helix transcriptional regulator